MHYDFDPSDLSEPLEEDPRLAPASWASLTGEAFWENLRRQRLERAAPEPTELPQSWLKEDPDPEF